MTDSKLHLLYMLGGLLLLGGGALAASQGVPNDVVGVLLGAGGSLLPTSFVGNLLNKTADNPAPPPTPAKPTAPITSPPPGV